MSQEIRSKQSTRAASSSVHEVFDRQHRSGLPLPCDAIEMVGSIFVVGVLGGSKKSGKMKREKIIRFSY
jgi:hypothetical protein